MMKINYDEKIQKINDDRKLMLNNVKDNILNNNNTLINNLDNIIEMINIDEVNTKKYTAIVRMKSLIFDLTEKIVNANSIEEITTLRKKINYYINKIKKELVERNIEQDDMDKIQGNVDYLRYDITKYIRFLKRETNITKISNHYVNISNLTIEENKEFKKLLANESRYNKRNLSSLNSYPTRKKKDKKQDDIIFQIEDTKENNDSDNNTIPVFEESTEVASTDDCVNVGTVNVVCEEITTDMTINVENNDGLDLITQKDDFTKLTEQIESHLSRYHFDELNKYDGNFIQNCLSLIKNFPTYFKNKKLIKEANFDYNVFYHGDDLAAVIEYFKKNTSIPLALELIFNKSSLSDREVECLFNHKKCIDWVIEFCNLTGYSLDSARKLIKS